MSDEELIARLLERPHRFGFETQDDANLRRQKEREVAADRIEALIAELAEFRHALIWCSGSADFNEGGVAREGWLKVCAPLLKGHDDE